MENSDNNFVYNPIGAPDTDNRIDAPKNISFPPAEEYKNSDEFSYQSKGVEEQPEPPRPRPSQSLESAVVGGGLGAAYGVGRAVKNGVFGLFGNNSNQKILQKLVESGSITPEAAASALGMPPPGGRIASSPAGGKMTGNWAISAGMDDPEALRARTQAEAHQLRLKAIEAEDKIKKLFGGEGSQYKLVPERASLMLPETPAKSKTYSQILAELAAKNPRLASSIFGMSKILGSAAGGAGAVFEGQNALDRFNEGDVTGATLSGLGSLSSGVGMLAPATLPITAPIAMVAGLGAAGREYSKEQGANLLERFFPLRTGLEKTPPENQLGPPRRR